MIAIPPGTQIWVACGATDMRRYALHTNMPSLRRLGGISSLFFNTSTLAMPL
jgi:hypothetical protein